ncbi:MAG: amidohydrolase family protein [Acidobacteria bacterium]|nr:amidohydrolase family protein [Acidobacteriota bacterium]
MMRRREFVALAAGAAQTGAGIIDTHTHFYDPTRPQGVPWPPRSQTLLYRTVLSAEYKALVRPLGVEGTIVVEASEWVEDNQWVLGLAKDDPFLLGLVGRLPAGTPAFADLLRRFAKNALFLGIRLGAAAIREGLERAAFIDDMNRLAERGLALDALGGAPMLADVARLAERVPALRIVIDHLPFDPPAPLDALRGAPRVYAKISGVLRRREGRLITDAAYYRPALDELCETFGPRRVIYGSNWPVSELAGPYAVVLRVVREYFTAKGEEASRLYFRGNSQAAYQWKPRANPD